MITGLRQSVNTYFAQLERTAGLCATAKMAKKMGIPVADVDDTYPSFTLGTIDVSPLDMAAAYATFPARRRVLQAVPVTEITGPDGEVVKKYKPKCKQVITKAAADSINEILRGVQQPGGFGSALHR